MTEKKWKWCGSSFRIELCIWNQSRHGKWNCFPVFIFFFEKLDSGCQGNFPFFQLYFITSLINLTYILSWLQIRSRRKITIQPQLLSSWHWIDQNCPLPFVFHYLMSNFGILGKLGVIGFIWVRTELKSSLIAKARLKLDQQKWGAKQKAWLTWVSLNNLRNQYHYGMTQKYIG